MANIKRYFRNLLIGLATLVLANIQPNNQTPQCRRVDTTEDEADVHMFI